MAAKNCSSNRRTVLIKFQNVSHSARNIRRKRPSVINISAHFHKPPVYKFLPVETHRQPSGNLVQDRTDNFDDAKRPISSVKRWKARSALHETRETECQAAA